MPRQKYKEFLLPVQDMEIPVKIYRERRNSIRASLAKGHAILRLPLNISRKGEQEQIDRFYFWLKDKVLTQEKFRYQFLPKHYEDGYTFDLFDRMFTLRIAESSNKNHSGKYLGNNQILIRLAQNSEVRESETEITRLISRVIAQLYQKDFEKRVLNINQQYFQEDVKSVKLKYNRSNWGSCSSSSNLNFSTRLLFANKIVQDYVIIHELAHLKELNHSKRFWKIVGEVMPEYKEHENWLKKNGHFCDFGL